MPVMGSNALAGGIFRSLQLVGYAIDANDSSISWGSGVLDTALSIIDMQIVETIRMLVTSNG